MDDDEIRTAVRTLAEPRAGGPQALDDVRAAVERKHRRRRAGSATAVLVTVAAVVAGAHAVSAPPFDSSAASDGRSLELTALGSVHGFTLEMTVRFPEDRELLSAYYVLGDQRTQATFYPNDGTDNDSYPAPIAVAAGTSVSVSAHPGVSCSSAATVPELVVTSRVADGGSRVDRFTASNPEDYSTEVTSWCPLGPYLSVSGVSASSSPSGRAVVVLQVVNPSDGPVHVVSQAFALHGAHWNRSSVVVPAGDDRPLTITARGLAYFETPDKPWTTGHLTSNGQSVTVQAR